MLSNKAKYALRAMGYLGEKYLQGPVQIAEIATTRNIPLKFLEAILLELRKADLLESKKGKGGGYRLAKSPDKIALATVLRLIDGPISMLPCVSLYFYSKCEDCDELHCRLHTIFSEVRDATLGILENRTIADLINSTEHHFLDG